MIPFLDIQKITASFEPELSAALQQAVASGWYLRGERTTAFERHFARFVGAEHCVGTANGLDALTLMLKALRILKGWKQGDQVLVPAFTFVATALAVNRAGLVPVFCEVSEQDFLLDVPKLKERITPRTRCVLPVHLYGKPFDVARLRDEVGDDRLLVLEDAAQAHGAAVRGRRTGSLGYAAAFSFYPGKNLGALGDAGAVVTDDEELAELVRTLGNYGARRKYDHEYAGLNSRLDELQAAVLDVKLPRLDADNARRRELARLYAERLSHPLVQVPAYDDYFLDSVCHIFPVFSSHRSELQAFLAQRGIQTLIHYPHPLHRLRVYSNAECDSRTNLPVAERLAQQELSLPISPVMRREEAERVAATINEFTL